MGLTDSQRNAVNTIDDNLQMVACAGSGKTTTMVARILNLLKQPNIKPQNIVAVTYSKKAAASLKQKIYKEFEKEFGSLEGLADMYIGTIHGYCYYLLQNYCDDYKNFELLEDVQVKLFMKRYKNDIGINNVLYHPKNGNPYFLAYNGMANVQIQEAITAFKTFLDIGREYGIERLDEQLRAYISGYERVLDSKSKFDYTSIIVKTLNLLEAGIFDNYISSNIKHLVVDEYQDVNDAQERIVRYFFNKGVRICVVGDDDQTIYHWRGSNLSYIRDFATRYSNVKREDLDLNFRSSKGITDVAQHVIVNNQNRINKEMKSNETQKYEIGDIIAYDFNDRKSEVDFIINKIKQLQGAKYFKDGKTYGLNYDDMVILVSSVKKIPELIEALRMNNIDFIVEGTQKLFEADEINVICKSFETIFALTYGYDKNTFSRDSFLIDPELVQHWSKYSRLNSAEIESALKRFVLNFHDADEYEYTIQENLKTLFVDLKLISQNLNEKIYYNWGKFTEIINDFEKIYLDVRPDYKLRAFQVFIRDDAPFIYPEGWLSPNFKTIRSLRIMTYHQSKGLEFPVVFLPFLTQNSIFPLKQPGGTSAWGIFNNSLIKREYENNDESYRRLFYVGITRSEKFLFMTRSPYPYGNGKAYTKSSQTFIEAKHSNYAYQGVCNEIQYEKSNEKKFSSDEVITLNFSLLKDLLDCPFKFEMLNVFGFHSPLNIRMGYGRSVHNMLDYVHKHYKTLAFDDKMIQRIVDKYLYLPYGSKVLIDAMQKKAFAHLKSYIVNNQSNFDNILFSEKTIDYNVDEYLFVDGRIDLVKDSLNDTVTIVDFKSSSDVLTKEQIKNQLMVYVLGYESLTGDKVDFIESYDFNNNDPTRIPVTLDDKDKFKKILLNCKATIKAANYAQAVDTSKEANKNYCKGCSCEWINGCFDK